MSGSGTSAEQPVRIDLAVDAAAAWLLAAQGPSGGWGQYPDSAPSVLNTAEAMISLIEVGSAEAGSAAIQRGKRFLLGRQRPDGSWCHDAAGERPGERSSAPDVLRTALVVQALKKAGCGSEDPSVARAIEWLRRAQDDTDGGWGYSAGGQPSTVLPTCAALNALLGAEATDCETCIRRGLDFLAAAANEDGSFGPDPHLLGAATITAVLTLQRARTCSFPVVVTRETGGLDWLLEHQDAALRAVEEEVTLDPTEPSLDYPFLHLTETGLIAALANASDHGYARSELFGKALRRIGDARDEVSGGFFGPRVFSWSTARSAAALWQAKGHQAEIPPRPAEEPPGPAEVVPSSGARMVVTGLVVLVAVAVVVLSILGAWSLGVGLVLLTLIILAMITYRILEPEQASGLLGSISSSLSGRGRDGPT
jgi:prenyltransferase beta subunit